MDENTRLAASLKVGISNYVASASLAVLAGALALYTYITQNFSPPWTFYAFMLAAGLALVASIYVGGDGADLTVARVAKDEWTNQATWQFPTQALLTLVALVLVILGTAIGAKADRAADGSKAELKQISRDLRGVRNAITAQADAQGRAAATLDERLEGLQRQLRALRTPDGPD
jgi:hypothetical protein